MKVADYLNENKPKVFFVRESEGVYAFGSKRVMLKADNGKLSVRVGGGFLSVEEFVD